jgi:hypothetical protein
MNIKINAKQKKFLKVSGIVLVVMLSIGFWYVSIPIVSIWYLYKKDKRFSPKTKKVMSIVITLVFLILGSLTLYSNKTPSLTLSEPTSGVSVQSERITVKGKVSPKDSVVTINNIPVETDGGSFSYDARLKNENNSLVVEVSNGGKKISQTLAISRIFTEAEIAEIEKQKEEAKLAQIEEKKKKIQKEIDSLNKPFDGSNFRGSLLSMQLELALFSSYATIAQEGKKHFDIGVQNLAKELEKKISQLQVSEFPKLRKAFAEMIDKEMWEYNMDVVIGGTSNKSITFTAGMFANNANIKEIHGTLQEALTLFRFNRANYKWYKYDDEYTYFNIKSESDSKVMVIE